MDVIFPILCLAYQYNYERDTSFRQSLSVCSFLQGCGFRELGVKVNNERRIPDKDITSSSQRDSNHAAFRGRIGIKAIGSWQDGWCSSGTDETPYIQVFFGKWSINHYFILSVCYSYLFNTKKQ